ncbi:MAG: hypothetical protein ACD_76C00045G0004 [uncultured bacterium]|nr:MAG: hypothetical protein ACD_76C00045G0004 [uncultured bacterium]HBD05212.1 hypothetical protein [Candidatus Uhrbacteria bacterium]
MGFESQSLFQKPTKQESFKTPQETGINKRARADLVAIYDKHADPNERIAEIIKNVERFHSYIDKEIFSVEKIEDIRKALMACTGIQDKEQFIDEIMKILKPAIDIREVYADKFEEAQAKVMNEEGGFTELNRLVSYGKSGPTIHIHHVPGETVQNKRSLYLDAMRKLAVIVSEDPGVQQIVATSWIVAKNPSIFTMSGFNVEDVSHEVRQAHFAGEKREIKTATMNREEFLKRFLKEKI